MRTKTLCAAVVLMMAVVAGSVAHAGPNTITYQGSVLRSDGNPVADGTYRMRFRVFDAVTAGNQRWEETDAAVPVANGLFSTILGDDSLHPFGSLFATYANLWIEVAIDLDKNGSFASNEVYAPRQKMSGAAWAIEAGNAFKWIGVTSTTIQAVANKGYVANNAAMVTITLPTSPSLALGDTIRVSGAGAGGWKIAQNAGQRIRLASLPIPGYGTTWVARESNRNWISVASSVDGTKLVACDMSGQIYTYSTNSFTMGDTTIGTGGYLSGSQNDAVELQYIGADTFLPLSHEGSLGAQ
jgi:hypothetical protein